MKNPLTALLFLLAAMSAFAEKTGPVLDRLKLFRNCLLVLSHGFALILVNKKSTLFRTR